MLRPTPTSVYTGAGWVICSFDVTIYVLLSVSLSLEGMNIQWKKYDKTLVGNPTKVWSDNSNTQRKLCLVIVPLLYCRNISVGNTAFKHYIGELLFAHSRLQVDAFAGLITER